MASIPTEMEMQRLEEGLLDGGNPREEELNQEDPQQEALQALLPDDNTSAAGQEVAHLITPLLVHNYSDPVFRYLIFK